MRKKGFTLVELLVVISIIALLLSILMPALNRAREQAKKVICLSNLGSLAKAINTYATGNDGIGPAYKNPADDGEGSPPSARWLRIVGDWPVRDIGASDPSYGSYLHDIFLLGGNSEGDDNPNITNPYPRKLNAYFKSAEKLFRCPSDKGSINVSGSVNPLDRIPVFERTAGTGSAVIGNSYAYNACKGFIPGNNGRILAGKQLSSIKMPSSVAAIGDRTMMYGWMDPDFRTTANSAYYYAAYPWHDPPRGHAGDIETTLYGDVKLYDMKGNLSFVDGHATTVTFKQKIATSEYRLWWP